MCVYSDKPNPCGTWISVIHILTIPAYCHAVSAAQSESSLQVVFTNNLPVETYLSISTHLWAIKLVVIPFLIFLDLQAVILIYALQSAYHPPSAFPFTTPLVKPFTYMYPENLFCLQALPLVAEQRPCNPIHWNDCWSSAGASLKRLVHLVHKGVSVKNNLKISHWVVSPAQRALNFFWPTKIL